MIVDDQPVKSPASDSTPLLGDASGQQADTELPQYTVHPAPIRSQRTKRSLSANRWVIIAVVALILGIGISAQLYVNVIRRVRLLQAPRFVCVLTVVFRSPETTNILSRPMWTWIAV